MILLNLKLNNILSFKDFDINFSYPKKLKKSTVANECLEGLPNFRYKKLNIILGANASGKTSLVKCIWKLLSFLSVKERSCIDEIINYNCDNSYIEADIVAFEKEECGEKKYDLKRVKIYSNNKTKELKMSISKVNLNGEDSYEIRKKDLDSIKDNYMNYVDCLNLNKITLGRHTILPATEEGFDLVRFLKLDSDEYTFILNQVLKTLDPSILNVTKSLDTNDAYVIEHENSGKIIVQNGNFISTIKYLSSGTKYGINIANLLYSIKNHLNEIYLIDEQFSYVNSDVEIAILNTMVSLLGEDEQIFFTTHNSNILDIKYPFHSFYFMKKEKVENKTIIKSACASLVENRNNVVPKTILDNDMLATAPDVNMIYELGE